MKRPMIVETANRKEYALTLPMGLGPAAVVLEKEGHVINVEIKSVLFAKKFQLEKIWMIAELQEFIDFLKSD